MATETPKHWRAVPDAQGIVWLHLDRARSSTNVLTAEVLDELDALLQALAAAPPVGLVIRSDKVNGFVAGADVRSFATIRDRRAAEALVRRGQAVFARLEALTCPTVALIHGFCLGGGLELALACRYRVARDDAATRLGLPEVHLGIFPAFGGTARMVRRVGALPALELMLSGRSVDARRARRLGLVEQAVPERHLARAAQWLIAEQPAPARLPWHRWFAGLLPVRYLLAPWVRRRTARQVDERHYPAPFRLIDHWARHAGDPAALYADEAAQVPELLVGPTSRNLVRVFLLKKRLKSLARDLDSRPRWLHVIGAGVMGGDIAAWAALQGMTVSLQDARPAALGGSLVRARALFRQRLPDPLAVQAAADRLLPDPEGAALARADVVIEAVYEDEAVKRAVYRDIEGRLRPEAVLATNTSSIPLEDLGRDLERPGRLVGLHFFNPVAKMQLVEVVAAADTEPEMTRRAMAFVRGIDRLPLPVRSAPGFLVNRLLMPYLLEAMEIQREGIAAAVVDAAARGFGMPMGPFALADSVGLDICLSVAEFLAERLPGIQVPSQLRTLVAGGHLGRKTGSGFYRYRNGRPAGQARYRGGAVAEALTDRLMVRMLNEAAACLREGVVGDADLLDAGAIFGAGFAPFRGGPMHYIHSRGKTELAATLRRLEESHGHRFEPDPGWSAL